MGAVVEALKEPRSEVAQDAFDAPLEAYEAVFLRWLGITITSAESETGPADLLALWQIDLTALFAPSQRYEDLGQYTFTDGFPADDPATKMGRVQGLLVASPILLLPEEDEGFFGGGFQGGNRFFGPGPNEPRQAP